MNRGAAERLGPWQYTFTGGRAWPFDPRPEDLALADIAGGLARIFRFGRASPMTVAQHSVEVSRRLPERLALQGLFHDAPECLLGDLNGPLKRHAAFLGLQGPGACIAWHEVEGRILDAVAQAFGFTLPLAPEVHAVDKRLLHSEARDLVPGAELADFGDAVADFPPYPARLEPWPPALARQVFLDRYQELTGVAEGGADFNVDVL